MGYMNFLESFCPNDLYNNRHALGCLALVVVSVYFRFFFFNSIIWLWLLGRGSPKVTSLNYVHIERRLNWNGNSGKTGAEQFIWIYLSRIKSYIIMFPISDQAAYLFLNFFGMGGRSYSGTFFSFFSSFCRVGRLLKFDTNYCTLVIYSGWSLIRNMIVHIWDTGWTPLRNRRSRYRALHTWHTGYILLQTANLAWWVTSLMAHWMHSTTLVCWHVA